jgi:hypothetical protein
MQQAYVAQRTLLYVSLKGTYYEWRHTTDPPLPALLNDRLIVRQWPVEQ